MSAPNVRVEALPQDLAAYTKEARGTAKEGFIKRRPYPFLLYAKSNLWDKTLLLAAASQDGGNETRIVSYDMVAKGYAFLSPVRPLDASSAAIVLGRATSNDMLVPVASISSHHATFTPPPGGGGPGWSITDMGSTNGTFLLEERLAAHTPTPVPDGEYLRLGGNLIAWFLSPGRLWTVLQDDQKLSELIDL